MELEAPFNFAYQRGHTYCSAMCAWIQPTGTGCFHQPWGTGPKEIWVRFTLTDSILWRRKWGLGKDL